MLMEKRYEAGVPDIAGQNLKGAEELGAVEDDKGNNKDQQHRRPFEVLRANRRLMPAVRAGRRVPAEMRVGECGPHGRLGGELWHGFEGVEFDGLAAPLYRCLMLFLIGHFEACRV